VLESLGDRHPSIDLRLLFGLEGDEEQIELPGKTGGEIELVPVEVVGGKRRENSRLCGLAVLRRVDSGQKKGAEDGA
jgi:hypothetical protein